MHANDHFYSVQGTIPHGNSNIVTSGGSPFCEPESMYSIDLLFPVLKYMGLETYTWDVDTLTPNTVVQNYESLYNDWLVIKNMCLEWR